MPQVEILKKISPLRTQVLSSRRLSADDKVNTIERKSNVFVDLS